MCEESNQSDRCNLELSHQFLTFRGAIAGQNCNTIFVLTNGNSALLGLAATNGSIRSKQKDPITTSGVSGKNSVTGTCSDPVAVTRKVQGTK